MGRIGATELLIILAIVLLLFGSKKIPELIRSLANGFNEFRKITDDKGHKEIKNKKEKVA